MHSFEQLIDILNCHSIHDVLLEEFNIHQLNNEAQCTNPICSIKLVTVHSFK